MFVKALLIFLWSGVISNQLVLTENDARRLQIIADAEKYLGLKYKCHVDKNIFDCSGYARYILAHNGVRVTRSSVSQIHDGKKVNDIKDAKPGDLVIFKGRNARNLRPGHVGIVHHVSNDTLYFIHSSVQKGITIDHLHDPYYKKRFLQIRNVVSGG
jgi:cell wall-associated NlpC family hydrolase